MLKSIGTGNIQKVLIIKDLKNMKNLKIFALFIWLIFFFFSCSDKSINSKNVNLLYQISGCANKGLGKTALIDSGFSYRFDKNLIVDFSVTANCCPDSNRFNLFYEVSNNTITVIVDDTAAHLCKCVCPYIIHAEFYDLPLQKYVFICNYEDKIVYREDVLK